MLAILKDSSLLHKIYKKIYKTEHRKFFTESGHFLGQRN
jgi:hypothetical protein